MKDYISIPIYWSEKDLQLLDGYYDGIENEEPEKFGKMLWDNGFDTVNYPVEVLSDTHRCLSTNKPHSGKRFVGSERTDRGWKDTGCMSMEALLSTADREVRKDMIEMSRRSKVEHANVIETHMVE